MTQVTEQLNTALADRYVIEHELGQGGMAMVYLARDLKHDRKVALKILRPELAAVIGAERFLNEIKVTANLQHPHILPLHDSGEAATFLYYVMPFVEGETLRGKLDKEKQLGLKEAITLATQVASALDYAHRQGVIHRDIKPENVLIHDGQALVADFGIALAVSHAGGSRLTETGLSIGTPHYMSPEQAMGDRELDARSDVYSLGAMLYEMLTGEPPYTGATAQAIVARVITEEPRPLTSQRRTVPANVAAAVHQALSKLPADRFASAAEFAAALENTGFTAAAAPAATAVPPPRRSAAFPLTAAIAVLLAGLAAWGWLRTTPASVVRVHMGFATGQELQRTNTQPFAISPNGATIAYLGPGADEGPPQIWVRQLAEIDARPLAGTEGALAPFFSPDGRSIGFFAQVPASLRIVAAGGGPVRTLVSDSVNPWGGAWGRDGKIYFSGPNGALWSVTSGGGSLHQVGILDSSRGYQEHDFPSLLPDGKTALVAGWTGGALASVEIAALDLETGFSTPLFPGVYAQYVGTGHLVTVTADGTLMAVPYDLKRRVVTGEAHLMLDGIAVDAASGAGRFVVSESGTLLYMPGGPAAGSQALWVDPGSPEPSVADPKWFAAINTLALSPDGRRLAVSITEGSGEHLWIKQLDAGPLTRLTFEGRLNYRPAWTRDGRFVTFISDRSGTGQLWMQRADGSAPARLLREDPRTIDEGFISADGRWLVYRTGNAGTRTRDIHAVRTSGSDTTPVTLADAPADEDAPALSPDGRWLAYVSDESGRRQVYVRPFPDAQRARWQVSIEIGDAPQWAPDGRRLYFVQRGTLYAVDVTPGETFVYGTPRVIVPGNYFAASMASRHAAYNPAPDGRRFITNYNMGSFSTQPVLVLNWLDELKGAVDR